MNMAVTMQGGRAPLPYPGDEPLQQEMRQLLQSRGVWDRAGRALMLEQSAALVVGRVCDDEPLLQTEAALGRSAPHRIVRGAAALAMLCDTERMILAVRGDDAALLRRMRQEAEGTRLEVAEVAASVPLDDRSLLCDLALAGTARRALVADAVVLDDVGTALEGRFPLRRTVTVAGAVQEPAVVQTPIGTTMQDLVQACGGSPDVGWVPWHNGVLGGRRAGWEDVVELDTRGVVVLPHDHPQVRAAATPLSDVVARIVSACTSCRICTDTCPVHLIGGNLTPHLVMQALSCGFQRSAFRPDGAALGALECIHCGVCNAACPAMLRPAGAIESVAERLREQGVALDGSHVLRPHPDRMGRRLSVARAGEMLGLRESRLPLPTIQFVPDRVMLPLIGPTGAVRVSTVQAGEVVRAGDIVAMIGALRAEVDLRAPVAGRVVRVDPDDGVVIEVR